MKLVLLILFPWLAGLLMQEPYGYIFAVDMWAAIAGFLMIMVVLPLILVDGFTENTWEAIAVMSYFWLMNWILR